MEHCGQSRPQCRVPDNYEHRSAQIQHQLIYCARITLYVYVPCSVWVCICVCLKGVSIQISLFTLVDCNPTGVKGLIDFTLSRHVHMRVCTLWTVRHTHTVYFVHTHTHACTNTDPSLCQRLSSERECLWGFFEWG